MKRHKQVTLNIEKQVNLDISKIWPERIVGESYIIPNKKSIVITR